MFRYLKENRRSIRICIRSIAEQVLSTSTSIYPDSSTVPHPILMHSELHGPVQFQGASLARSLSVLAYVAVCAGVVACGELDVDSPCLALFSFSHLRLLLRYVDVAHQLRLAERPFARALWHLWQIFLEGGECLHKPQAM